MMLPNFISVSVMPGCWALAVVAMPKASSAENKAGANLLDRIMLHPPRRMAENVVIGFDQRLGHARPAGLVFSCWTQHAARRACKIMPAAQRKFARAKSGHRDPS